MSKPNTTILPEFDKRDAHNEPLYTESISNELEVLLNPTSNFAREILASASKLQSLYLDKGLRSVCVTSDGELHHATVVAANIASATALIGLRTVLIETDLEHPRIAAMFGLPQGKPGLSEWIEGASTADSWTTFMSPVYPNLIVVPAGMGRTGGSALLTNDLSYIVNEFARTFDAIICSAPSMLDEAGLLATLTATECAVFVARKNQTKVKNLISAEDLIAKCHSHLCGVIYIEI
jgi:Mrp family chromosome partitioning ATPase